MKKRPIKHATMLNLKGMLYLIAFGIWVFIMMRIADTLHFSKEAILSYGGSTALIIFSVYILFLLLELFLDIEDIG